MRERIVQLVKNTSLFYAAEILGRVLTVLFLVYAARVMGVRNFGDFSYALAIMMILGVVSDYGASNLLVKMVAQESSAADKHFWTFTAFRWTVTVVAVAAVTAGLYASGADPDVVVFLVLVGAGMVLGCYGQNVGFVFRGRNRMSVDSAIRLSLSFLTALLGILSLRLGFGIVGVGASYFVAYAASSVIAWAANARSAEAAGFSPPVFGDYFKLLRTASPFFVWTLMSMVYSRADTILLQHLRGPEDVGLYNAASRVIEAVMVIPAGIYVGILPILSGLASERDHSTLERVTHFVMRYSAYLGFFIACYVALTADKIIEVLYFSKEYEAGVAPLRVLVWGTAAAFLYIVPSALVVAGPKPYATAWLASIATGLNIALNLVVIPRWGVTGAAWVRLATEIVGLVLVTVYVSRTLLRVRYGDFLPAAVLSTLITGAFIYLVRSLLFLPIYAALYAALLYLFRGLPRRELIEARDLVARAFAHRG